ncbi:MAG TPA: hypothetical protein VFV52_06125 [Bacilli bacterium]|nr:hypothetical protein [Bacilli bacterium]
MYVGRTLEQLKDVPLTDWTVEELAYHFDTMNLFEEYLNDNGTTVLQMVESEIDQRGGLPHYGGDYEHPATVTYE